MNRREWGYWVWIVCDPRYLFLFTHVAHLLTFIWLISFIHPTFLWCFISRGGKLCELRWNTSTRRGKLFRLSFLTHLHLSLLDFLALHQVDSRAFWCPLLLVCFFFFFFSCYLVKRFLWVCKMHFCVSENKSGILSFCFQQKCIEAM